MLRTFASSEGRTLSYLRRGTGPLVVCVPGGPGMDPEAYFAPLELPGYELLIFAPRGTGASDPPPSEGGYRIAGYVSDLESLRAHLGAEELTIYGNSHGGCVALAYACAHPERVARLVVTNCPPRMDADYESSVAEAKRRFAEAVPDAGERVAAAEAADQTLDTGPEEQEARRAFRTLMARYVAQQGAAETAYLDRLCAAPMNWDAVRVMYAEMQEGLDLLRGADGVTAPALAIAGELDVTVPSSSMRLIADALPNGRYLEFTGVGHFVEVEAGHEFSAKVCDFLAG